MTKREYLDKVINILEQRGKEYGPGCNEATAVCKAFSALTGMEFKQIHLFLIMALMKSRRHMNTPKEDNWLDIAGYASICQEAENETEN